MIGDIRRLGKETLAYGLSSIVARLLNFLLIPFYTHFLLPADLGVVATVFAYIAVLNILYQYGMDQAYMRFASGEKSGPAETVFSTAFFPVAGTALIFSLCLHFGAEPLGRAADFGRHGTQLVRYAAWIMALDALAIVPFAELRLRHRVWTYVGVRVFSIALNVAMNVYLLARIGFGVRGVFIAGLTASAATLVLLAPVAAQRLNGRLDAKLLPGLLRFGLPLVPAGIGAMMVQVIDRPILQHLTDKATVGVYQANYKLGIFMMLVVGMFDQAWRPFFLERAGKPGSREVFGRVLTYFMLLGLAVVLTLSLFIAEIIRIPVAQGKTLIEAGYWGGVKVVPVVLAAYLLHGTYVNFMASVTISKRTDLLPWVTLLGAAVNIVSNLVFIPIWGMMGAAWATFTAYASMAAALYVLGRRVYPIPYEYGRLARLLCAAGAVAGAAALGYRATGGEGWTWAAARVGALALMPVFLLATRFFKPDELRDIFPRGGGR